jgi:hypothetical protein
MSEKWRRDMSDRRVGLPVRPQWTGRDGRLPLNALAGALALIE